MHLRLFMKGALLDEAELVPGVGTLYEESLPRI